MKSPHLLLLLVLFGGCRAEKPPGSPRTAPAPPATEVIYRRGLRPGWMDYGWSPRKPNPNGPQLHDLSGYGGWILVREYPTTTAVAGGVSFTFTAPKTFGDFLQVALDQTGAKKKTFPAVRLAPRHLRPLESGAVEVYVPMDELNPKRLGFDRVVFFAYKDVPRDFVAIDEVALTVPGAETQSSTAKLVIDCKKSHRISPLIYGIAFYPMWEYQSDRQWRLKPTARRWGGNHTSRYNWKLGEAWNAGLDWFFKNLTYTGKPGWTYETFLDVNAEHDVQSVITLPIIGWVAKDTSSFSYPKAQFPKQAAFEPGTEAGNGKGPDGKLLEPPEATHTSIAAPPEFIGEWVATMKAREQKLGRHGVTTYILDNEPNLWSSTHHDVHPQPLGYDELLDRTFRYATAVRKADPDARIAGPAEWGWSAYLYSQKDLAAGVFARPDRRAHGDVPLVPWYLQQLAAHEKKTGTKLLDVLDLHFYPQANGIGNAETGDTSPEASLRRIRSTRALWDPTYHDESWIDENVQLIPRMKQWVAESYPGLGTQIGEWNFGAETHQSGGLAVAEALGRFGQNDLTAAYYWAYPPDGSPAFWAFRAFRDYDGKGAHFESWSLPASAPAGTSLFASLSDDGTKLVAVALNLDPKASVEGNVTFSGCGETTATRRFVFANGGKALEPAKEGAALEPWSINVFEWSVKAP